jgi:serine protease Do
MRLHKLRWRAARRVVHWTLGICLLGQVDRALGQTPSEPVFVPSSVVANDAANSERERLYAEIQGEFAAFDRQGNLLKKVVRLVRPAVVHLESIKPETLTYAPARADRRQQPTVEEAGSGVIIDISGTKYVLTNRHVVRDARLSDVTIRLYDGRLVKPVRVLSDPDTDVAVIQISYTGEIISARLGDSDQIDIGDFVLAVGSPFGLSHSVSYGIVSAKGRRDLELGTDYVRLQDFLQTDAAINPGNSGGPLVSLRGEVIGINTAIASSSGGNEGVSFAIPVNLAMFVARQLIARGAVEHAYLGVQLENEFDLDKAMSIGIDYVRGALVKGVTPRSPAYFANLQAHDLIVSFNGVNVEDDDHLVNLVSLTPIESTVPVEIIRKSKRMAVEVKVGNRKHFEVEAK